MCATVELAPGKLLPDAIHQHATVEPHIASRDEALVSVKRW